MTTAAWHRFQGGNLTRSRGKRNVCRVPIKCHEYGHHKTSFWRNDRKLSRLRFLLLWMIHHRREANKIWLAFSSLPCIESQLPYQNSPAWASPWRTLTSLWNGSSDFSRWPLWTIHRFASCGYGKIAAEKGVHASLDEPHRLLSALWWELGFSVLMDIRGWNLPSLWACQTGRKTCRNSSTRCLHKQLSFNGDLEWLDVPQ